MARKTKFSLILMLFMVCVPSLSSAQTAGEAVNALKLLETKVAADLSFRDYGPALTEAGSRVKGYLDTADARRNSEIAAALTRVLQHYEAALDIWSEKYAGREAADIITDGYMKSAYHRCANDYRAAVDSSRNYFTGKMTYSVQIADCLSRIWGKASEALAITAIIMSHVEKKSEADQVQAERMAAAYSERKAEATRAEVEALKKENEKIKTDCDRLKEEHRSMQQELDTMKKEKESQASKRAAPAKKKKKKK